MENSTSTPTVTSTDQPSSSERESPWERLLNQPHVVQARQDIANGWRQRHAAWFAHCQRGQRFGLYNDCPTIDDDALSWESKNLACTISPSLVSLGYESSDYIVWKSSGIVVEHNGQKQIVTSAYILGNRSWEGTSLPVEVLLPNREKVPGIISYVDEHYNIAIIRAQLGETTIAASFDTNLFKLGDAVTAVGRRYSPGLTIFPGKINMRKDHLESDDLMSSSCMINESGIGGPLVSNSLGKVIGMNFFSTSRTPFMPSNVLLRCVQHLLDYGTVIRPYLGFKTRSLNEINISDLESIYLKFHSTTGLMVTQVTTGSPADIAGICVGDVIISSFDTIVSSPPEFAKVLLERVRPHVVHSKMTGNTMPVQVTVGKASSGTIESCILQAQTFAPPVIDRWPVLPDPVDLMTTYLF